MVKKSLLKNNFKTIIKTRRRFISILAMAFLGVGFYSGLVASSPDMLNSLDKYTDTSNMFDISIVSTLGLTDSDLNELNKIDGVDRAYGIQTKDTFAKFNNKESICKVIEYNENINKPVVIAGRLPENINECLLDAGYSKTQTCDELINKTIIIENDDKDENENVIFTQKEFKVVGIAQTPLYISSERGNTNIGSGSIDFFIYTNDNVINLDYYTQIDLKVAGASVEVTNSEPYVKLVDDVFNKIEDIEESREQSRYNELVGKANEKVDDAQKEYDEEKTKVEKELKDAESSINNAKGEIETNENKIDKAEKELNTKEQSSKKQLKEAEIKIEDGQKNFNEKEQLFKRTKETFENGKKQIQATISEIEQKIELIKAQEQTEEALKQIQELETKKITIQSSFNEQEKQIVQAEKEINSAKQELEKSKQDLQKSKNQANIQIENAKAQISANRKKIANAKTELQDKEQEFINSKKEAEEKLQNAQNDINDARDEIKKIEMAKWYIQDRKSNSGYTNIFDAIETMSNISKMFPVIFYLVAVLISLTSMTRMIEEERIEIGTLKSLGYTNFQIVSKYINYAFFACIIGGIFGMMIGFNILPRIVWSLYSIIYKMPNFYVSYYLDTGLMGTAIAFICIGGATLFVAYKELKQMPSTLMRPKPPKNGKKIILEKCSFVWKKLNFSKKVTARNIFRYKSRAIITIVGIAGCTGLMLTGFGIRDSVVDIPQVQFEEIFKYDTTISLTSTEHFSELIQYLNDSELVENYTNLCASKGEIKSEKLNYNVTIFVPENAEQLERVCQLKNSKINAKINLTDNGIIITNKIADMFGIKENDEVSLVDSNDVVHKLRVEAITDNYVSHYVYMSKSFYEKNFETYKTNMLLVNNKEMTQEQSSTFSESILNIDGVASVSIVDNLIKQVSDMLNTMNYVVIVLIVSSAILAFVVLYNLANINIGERQREIATLKVLGFYDKEVDNYINKENIIFTIMGVLIRTSIWKHFNKWNYFKHRDR